MSTEIKLPMLSMGMTEGTIGEWLAVDGATVQEGTVIYTLESDKALEEVQAPATGVLRITGKVGQTYPVGEVIGQIE